MVPLSPIGTIISHLVTNPHVSLFRNPVFYVALCADVLFLAAYGLGRSRKYYELGAGLVTGTIVVATLAATAYTPEEVETLLIFLTSAVLLGSLLFSVRGVVILSIGSSVAMLLLPVFAPAVPVPSVINVLIYFLFTTVLIVVSASIRHRDTTKIEEQARSLEILYQQSESHAEALQRVTNRLEAILNSVGEGLAVVSLDGYIEQVNPAFEEQTGYEGGEIALRHYDELVLGSQLPESTEQEAFAAMEAGRIWRGEMPIERKDGSTYEAAVTISPVRNRVGNVISYAISLRDISALKEVERLKDAFVSNVSHELRTPLSNLKIYLSLLNQADPDELESYVDTLRRETNRLHHIVEDLLRLSRLDQDRADFAFRDVYLNSLVRQYVADRVSLAQEKGIELILAHQAEGPVVSADEGMLGQVLSILLTNAINYSGPGGQVKVATHIRKKDRMRWCGFSVTDRGPGITPEEQNHLFERFFRGQAASESGAPGTGLGLAIAKEIVDLHGGQIDVESEGVPGKGAAFFVWLPNNGKET